MATTNGTFWSQTFGINFGTLGCTNDGKVWAEHKREFFIAATFDNLAGDMARGEGENLSALAVLLGVPSDHQAESFAFVQEQYLNMMSREENSSTALIKALNEATSRHPVFAKMSQTDQDSGR